MNRPYHIVIEARMLRTSTGRYIERLLHYLQEIDTVNTYTVLLKPTDLLTWTPSSPNFKALACPHKEYSFSEQLHFAYDLYRLKPDLVHFSMEQQPLLYRGKTVTTIHDLTLLHFGNPSKNQLLYAIKQYVYRHAVKVFVRKSTMVIAPTEYVKNDVMKYTGVAANKMMVTYESADKLAKTSEPYKFLRGKDYIMYVGRSTPHKNLDRLIDAFVLLQKMHPNLYLVLAGKLDANYRIHMHRIEREGIKNVVFTDFISDAQLQWLYEHTEVYCFPSLSEGFGLPGLEAMLHGAPVASSNATCLPEVYGSAAVYFDPNNIHDISRRIDELLQNKMLRDEYRLKGKERAKEFSWRRMAEQTHEVYQRAVRQQRQE